MSKYYATIDGSARTQATRCGTARSGIRSCVATWNGAIEVTIRDVDGVDRFEVRRIPWHGAGEYADLISGELT